MIAIFNELLYRPLFNLLIGIYNLIPGHDFGVAVIILTVLIRVILMPLSIKALVSQKNIAKIQPQLKELQKKFKDNKEALTRETMALYKTYGVNPLSGCLPLLIQIPILFALYSTFINGFKPETLNLLYGFVQNPGSIKLVAFGFLNISSKNYILALLAGVFQFIQSKKSIATTSAVPSGDKKDFTQAMNKQMLYFLPIFITIIAWNLPAGLTLYWVATTLFSIFEQFYIAKKYK